MGHHDKKIKMWLYFEQLYIYVDTESFFEGVIQNIFQTTIV